MKKVRQCLATIGLISFCLVLYCAGSMEDETMKLLDGIILSTIYFAFIGLCASANSALDEIERQYIRKIPVIKIPRMNKGA